MGKRKQTTTWIIFCIVLVMALLFVMPFFLVILNSFKESTAFVANPFSFDTFGKVANYITAFDTMNFLNAFKNSIIIVVIATAVSSILSAMNAYVITRYRWKINKVVYMLLIAAMVIPYQVIMIPQVKLYGSYLGLTNNIWLVTFLHIGLNIPFPTFLYSGFVSGIPAELDEAALIDGASSERTFFTIILPLLKPITITCVIFTALSIWNDYILASTFLSLKEVKTLPLMTYAFLGNHSADYAPMMAGLVLTMLPVLLLYLAGQKYVIEGIVAGSVKG